MEIKENNALLLPHEFVSLYSQFLFSQHFIFQVSLGTEDFPVSQEFCWDGKSCFLPGQYTALENLKPKNPRHTKVIRSFLMVLMLPRLSSSPAQVSLWLGNCNLALQSVLSSPVPHGKWFCPQGTEQTRVVSQGRLGSWAKAPGHQPQANGALLSRAASPGGIWAGNGKCGHPAAPGFTSTDPITPPSNYTATLSISPMVNSPCHCTAVHTRDN